MVDSRKGEKAVILYEKRDLFTHREQTFPVRKGVAGFWPTAAAARFST